VLYEVFAGAGFSANRSLTSYFRRTYLSLICPVGATHLFCLPAELKMVPQSELGRFVEASRNCCWIEGFTQYRF
jgi:hypothetical protein